MWLRTHPRPRRNHDSTRGLPNPRACMRGEWPGMFFRLCMKDKWYQTGWRWTCKRMQKRLAWRRTANTVVDAKRIVQRVEVIGAQPPFISTLSGSISLFKINKKQMQYHLHSPVLQKKGYFWVGEREGIIAISPGITQSPESVSNMWISYLSPWGNGSECWSSSSQRPWQSLKMKNQLAAMSAS